MMYALVSLWQLPEAPWEVLQPQLEQGIVPFARQSSGFVAGYWTYEPANGKSFGFVLLTTAEHAYDLKNAIENHMEALDDSTIQLEMLRVQAIVAHVPAAALSGGRPRPA